MSELSESRHEEIFLLNRLNLLNFNIYFFYCKLWQSPREFISVGVHLSKAAGFRTAVLLGMISYAGILGSLLKCLELPILQNTSGWLLPFVFMIYEPTHILSNSSSCIDLIFANQRT